MTSAVRVSLRLATPDEGLAAGARPLLDASERAREARFQHAGARQEFLVGRWLVRTTLGEILGLDPAALRFVDNRWGAPRLDPTVGDGQVRFNLSHTCGLVALAVARGVDVGVDVEDVERRGRTLAIAERFFAPTEVAALRRLPDEQQRERFFTYWTLKESYIKARGMGLAIPLRRFAFAVDAEPITVAIDPALGDAPSRWSFRRLSPTPRHRLALAVATEGRPLAVEVAWRGVRCLHDEGAWRAM